MPPQDINKQESSLKLNNKKVLIGISLLLVLGLAYSLYLGFKTKPTLSSHAFSGTVQSVNTNSLLVRGRFLVNGQLYRETNTEAPHDVEILVTPQTKFNSTIVYSPTIEELAKTGGKWDMSKVKQEIVAGSINDFASSSGVVYVESDADIFGQSTINAKSISYSLIKINPESTQRKSGLCEDSTGKYIGAAACLKISTK